MTVVSRKFHGNMRLPSISLSARIRLGVECRRNTGADTIGLYVGIIIEVVLTFASVGHRGWQRRCHG